MPCVTLTKAEDITTTVKQNMKIFESYCERFPIFIPRLMMFKSFLEQLNDSSKNKGGSKAKEFLNSGIACAKAMNDKPSVERLTSNLEYLEGKRRLVWHFFTKKGDRQKHWSLSVSLITRNMQTNKRSDKWVKTILMTVGAKKLNKLKKQKTHFIFTGPYNYPWISELE